MGYPLRAPVEESSLTRREFAPQWSRLVYSPISVGLVGLGVATGVYALTKGCGMFWRGIFHSRSRTATPVFTPPMLGVTTRLGEDGYVIAECPELPGCMSQGRNKEEALRNI